MSIFIWQKKQGLFAKLPIKHNEIIGVLSVEELISNEINLSSFSNQSYYKEHIQYPSLDLNKDEENEIRIVLNLLYHFYHYEDSNLKFFLQQFPSKPDIPLFTLSEYEANLLKSDPAYELNLNFITENRLLQQIRQKCIIGQNILFKKMLLHWNKEQIRSYLNGRDFISQDDYTYAYYIYLTRFFTFRLNEDDIFYFIAPLMSNAAFQIANSSEVIQNNVIYTSSTSNAIFYANKNYNQGDEITYYYENNGPQYSFLVHGKVFEMDFLNCFDLTFFDREQAQIVVMPASYCFTSNDNQILKYFISCCLANMEEKEAQNCQDLMISARPDIEKMFEIMQQECKIPTWSKFDFFANPKKQLNNTINSLELDQLRAKEYRIIRHMQLKDRANANLIIQFLEKRIKVAKNLFEKIEQLESILPNKDKENEEFKNKEKSKSFENEKIIDLDSQNDKKQEL